MCEKFCRSIPFMRKDGTAFKWVCEDCPTIQNTKTDFQDEQCQCDLDQNEGSLGTREFDTATIRQNYLISLGENCNYISPTE